jgi:hypothetical protein
MEEELIKKNIRMNRFKIIMDIILVIVLLGIFYYVYSEIELFKILGKDVCKMCMEKTDAICYTGKYGVVENVLG